LENKELKRNMEKKVYRYSRGFTWSEVAKKYADVFIQAIHA
jgi:hypothetical protein